MQKRILHAAHKFSFRLTQENFKIYMHGVFFRALGHRIHFELDARLECIYIAIHVA